MHDGLLLCYPSRATVDRLHRQRRVSSLRRRKKETEDWNSFVCRPSMDLSIQVHNISVRACPAGAVQPHARTFHGINRWHICLLPSQRINAATQPMFDFLSFPLLDSCRRDTALRDTAYGIQHTRYSVMGVSWTKARRMAAL